MSATFLGAIVAIVIGYASGLAAILQVLGRRLDRIEDRLDRLEQGQTDIKVAQAAYAQRLDDHITNHPGPAHHLEVRS